MKFNPTVIEYLWYESAHNQPVLIWADYFEGHNISPLGPKHKEVRLNLFVCYLDAQNAPRGPLKVDIFTVLIQHVTNA